MSNSIEAGAKTVWSQLGVYDARWTEGARCRTECKWTLCIKVEFMRLGVKLTT